MNVKEESEELSLKLNIQKTRSWSLIPSVQLNSVAQSCPILCDPMNRSMPGLPVHHQLPEFTQTHVPRVNDAIQHLILCRPLLLLPSIFLSLRIFSNESVLRIRWPNIGVSASTSVLPMNIQDWSPRSPRDSQESSPTPQFKSINSSALSFLYSPILTFIHNYWKNHNLDETDLCWQSNVSAF